MRASDQLLARLAAEIEEQQSFQDRLLEGAQNENRDLTDNEMELFTRSRDRLQALNTQLEPVKESRRISSDSQNMISELAKFIQDEKPKTQPQVEYRSAGAYVLDMWKAGLGAQDAVNRLETYNRAAAHQTTTDNPGLLPSRSSGRSSTSSTSPGRWSARSGPASSRPVPGPGPGSRSTPRLPPSRRRKPN